MDADVLEAAAAVEGDRVESRLDSGLTYFDGGPPVEVLVRRRPGRYLVSDDGSAVEVAGRPAGWREVADDVIAAHGLNVNRRGVVSVPAVPRQGAAWLDSLTACVADASLALYEALLELDE